MLSGKTHINKFSAENVCDFSVIRHKIQQVGWDLLVYFVTLMTVVKYTWDELLSKGAHLQILWREFKRSV